MSGPSNEGRSGARSAIVTSRLAGRWVLRPVTEWGYRRYLRTDQTPPVAYSAARKLFAADPEGFERLASRSQREHLLLEGIHRSVGLAAGEVDSLVARLREDGIAVLATRLPEAECTDLEAAARRARCVLTAGRDDRPSLAVFDPTDVHAVRYDLDEADVVCSLAAQRLLADESLLALAQEYLGAAPVQDMVAMWWSAAAEERPSSAAAQLYHFDLDRLRFLKVFVYLSDVDDSAGPHSYVRGSHRRTPPMFRADRRFNDAEVDDAFAGAPVAITGRRGTVFLADTRGLHKGLPLVHGHRLVFQMEYTTSLFGQAVRRLALPDVAPELVSVVTRFPHTYRRFAIGDA